MIALLTADEAAGLRVGVNVIVRPGDFWEACSRCGGSGMQDYGGSIGECSSCGGNTVQRVQGERGRFTHRAPQDWVALTGPCPTCDDTREIRRPFTTGADAIEPCPDCNPWAMCGPRCIGRDDCIVAASCLHPQSRDGRRIVPLYTECSACRGSGTVRGGYPDYDALDCPRCENDEGTVLAGRGSIEVVPVTAPGDRCPGMPHLMRYLRGDSKVALCDGTREGTATDFDGLDPLPVPGRDFGIVIDVTELA